MGAIFSFFSSWRVGAEPHNTKKNHVINIANLNYCGIMKSPFEFYSGKYQKELSELSKTFRDLTPKYIPLPQFIEGEENKLDEHIHEWEFAKLDKKIKDRYCPLYDVNVGIENGKFVSKKRFRELWEEKQAKQQARLKLQFSKAERTEALLFDMLVFHTLLFQVFHVLNIDDAANLSVQKYLATYEPFFAQSFLDQKRKLVQFKKGLQESVADVVFVQQPDEFLIKDVEKFKDKYFISVSPDKDTLIFAKNDRFHKQNDHTHFLEKLSAEQLLKLNWNGHNSYLLLDNYFLISGHLNSKKEKNVEDMKDLREILPILQKLLADEGAELICGLDANGFVPPFVKESGLHVYPDKQDIFTCVKKRTSLQVQSSKAEKLVRELKDVVITTLPVNFSEVLTISGSRPKEDELLPLNEHPFDHFLVFAVVQESKDKSNH